MSDQRLCARPGCGTVMANHRADAVWCSNACRMAAQRQRERAQSAHAKLTQAERVLIALAGARERGITQVDFQLPHVIDGGPPITRLAARIEELRQQGHTITSGERRQRCVVYRLVSSSELAAQPSGRTVAADTGVAAEPALLSSSGSAAGQLTRNAIFGWEDAA